MIESNGETWWVLSDICKVLDLSTPSKVADRLDLDEKGMTSIHTLGGKQNATIVNESGLYSVILRSDKPEAKAFADGLPMKYFRRYIEPEDIMQ